LNLITIKLFLIFEETNFTSLFPYSYREIFYRQILNKRQRNWMDQNHVLKEKGIDNHFMQ